MFERCTNGAPNIVHKSGRLGKITDRYLKRRKLKMFPHYDVTWLPRDDDSEEKVTIHSNWESEWSFTKYFPEGSRVCCSNAAGTVLKYVKIGGRDKLRCCVLFDSDAIADIAKLAKDVLGKKLVDGADLSKRYKLTEKIMMGSELTAKSSAEVQSDFDRIKQQLAQLESPAKGFTDWMIERYMFEQRGQSQPVNVPHFLQFAIMQIKKKYSEISGQNQTPAEQPAPGTDVPGPSLPYPGSHASEPEPAVLQPSLDNVLGTPLQDQDHPEPAADRVSVLAPAVAADSPRQLEDDHPPANERNSEGNVAEQRANDPNDDESEKNFFVKHWKWFTGGAIAAVTLLVSPWIYRRFFSKPSDHEEDKSFSQKVVSKWNGMSLVQKLAASVGSVFGIFSIWKFFFEPKENEYGQKRSRMSKIIGSPTPPPTKTWWQKNGLWFGLVIIFLTGCAAVGVYLLMSSKKAQGDIVDLEGGPDPGLAEDDFVFEPEGQLWCEP